MMKKMKGAAPVRYPSSHGAYGDPRMMFKHQSLVQEYDALQKDTQAARVKLELMKQKKLNLLAEVRFLRRRQKFLMIDQSSNTCHAKNIRHFQNVEYNGKDIVRISNYRTNSTIFEQQAPAFDLNRKERVANGKKAAFRNPVPRFNLNQKDRSESGKKVNSAPVFDLNQISMEEEIQPNYDLVSIEEPKKVSVRVGIDEHTQDGSLSICRNIVEGTNRAGKRKISWQDQVALRV